jgi:tetratricopeptide (TPR) repeat protein
MSNTMQWMKTITLAGAMMAAALPQANAQTPTGSIHGHIQNAAGLAVTGGDVKLTTEAAITETTKFKYDLPVDANGNYKSDGIEVGTYNAAFYQDGKTVDFLANLKVVAAQNLTADFDMTRKEYIDKMTPDEKKALEDYKSKVGATLAENSKISNANTLLQQARDDMKNKDYAGAETALQQAVSAKPDEGILWFTLGDAQAGERKYDDAITSYKKAIDLNDASKKPKPDVDAASYNNMGQAEANAGQTTDAAAAYESAAKIMPANAGMYYNNEAAVFFNHGDLDAALAAADKAIAADPTRPDPYFVRGQVLIQKATVDKAGKIVAPPGCADAYQKYLELAPTGPHAQDATDILGSMGETIHSSYKAGKAAKN